MGITPAGLATRYPTLYHMASFGSWPSIQEHGLLSSSELVRLFEVSGEESDRLLTRQRNHSILLEHVIHGKATLRDQKPLSSKSLQRCLTDCDATAWYSLLNERVFFWLNRERLHTLMLAREYVGKPHVVLSVDSLSLVEQYQNLIEIAHMNTGNTRPFAHPRGRSTFRALSDYDYAGRKRLSDYSAIVELTIPRGVRDVKKFVVRAEHASITNGEYHTQEVLFAK